MRYAPLRQLTRRGTLAGTIATPFLTSRLANAVEPAGTVEALRGEATAQSGSDIRPLARDASLFVGELVATGMQSAIAMRLGAPPYRSVPNQSRRCPGARQGRRVVRSRSRGGPN
jgi:hypothetical protein